MRTCLTLLTLLLVSAVHATGIRGFKLIENDRAASVRYDGDEIVVQTALEMLTEDSKLVCAGAFSRTDGVEDRTVFIGIPDREPAFRQWVERAGIDASGVLGKWEAYLIREGRIDGRPCLFVLGSDPRGAAYGVLELSRQIGVSPWVWWADVVPEKRTEVSYVPDGRVHAPSVQYRGIFLNDEDWGLMPWSTRTFEPTPVSGGIGPKTYAKICELLLRLRANTLWPAMHECTVPFYFTPGNKEAAHRYGIVMGTSHCEPMMRTNTGEWDPQKYGPYNFIGNRERVLDYWGERLSEVAETENIYTLGMRGVHDGRMQGVSSVEEEAEVLQQVIVAQRELLKESGKGEVATIPQAFIPYKEVVKAYDAGLELPDDVTLVWCDDNHGYIMRQNNAAEQRRSGGGGVYYHVSYWGKPHDYLWLASTQPGLVYSEMRRAWDNNSRRMWILNVGDIKPAEYLTEFFLDMAWDIDAFSGNNLYAHQQEWIGKVFGGIATEEIAAIQREYYRLAGQRKPEHMGWNKVEPTRPVHDSELSPFYFGDEMESRIAAYDRIAAQSEGLWKNVIPETLKPAYFQLVHYPVAASAAMNRKILYAQKSRFYAGYDLPVAEEYAREATGAYREIAALDYAYNKDMGKGKWELMMDMKPRDLPVFQQPVLPELPGRYPTPENELTVWVENRPRPVEDNKIILPAYSGKRDETYLLTIHPGGKHSVRWEVAELPGTLEVTETGPSRLYEKRLAVTSQGVPGQGWFTLTINGQAYTVEFRTEQVPEGRNAERNRMIALNAADFTNSPDLERIEGLGHSGRAVRLPAVGRITDRSVCAEYNITTVSRGNVRIKIGTIPKHPLSGGDLRYALVVDDQAPVIVSTVAGFLSDTWADNVLRNQSLTETEVALDRSGAHTIRVYALDEELLLDQLMLEFDPQREHYLIPAP